MAERNLSPYVFFKKLGAGHKPHYRFTGKSRQEFSRWKKMLLPKVLASLGTWPTEVAPRPQLIAQWVGDGLIKQRWMIDVQPNLSAIVLVFQPGDLGKDEKRPAILCCHGHGQFAKDSVMGLDVTSERAQEIKNFNYDYGLKMAQAGFVTYALDWLGFGERNSAVKPHFHSGTGGRDHCNIHYLCATMLGTTVLVLNCHDAARATDFICTLPFVDSKRLGVMGLSYGGTMTTWCMLTDERFIAGDIICYAGPFHDIAYKTYNVCGSQVTPGLFELCDVAELQGLIAPKPLLVELGIHDTCFQVDDSYTKHWPQLRRIYKAAGASEHLELDLFTGEHAWGANQSALFFKKALGGDP